MIFDHKFIKGELVPIDLFSNLRDKPIFGVLINVGSLRCRCMLISKDDRKFLGKALQGYCSICGCHYVGMSGNVICDFNHSSIHHIINHHEGYIIRKSRRSKQFKRMVEAIRWALKHNKRMTCRGNGSIMDAMRKNGYI